MIELSGSRNAQSSQETALVLEIPLSRLGRGPRSEAIFPDFSNIIITLKIWR